MVAGMAAVLGLAASCTDLDVDVNSQYTSYPNSEIAISAKMADLYYAFADRLAVATTRHSRCRRTSMSVRALTTIM